METIEALTCSAILICALVLSMLTGCAGLAVGGELGIYRVDGHSYGSETDKNKTKPLACMLWKDCADSQGS